MKKIKQIWNILWEYCAPLVFALLCFLNSEWMGGIGWVTTFILLLYVDFMKKEVDHIDQLYDSIVKNLNLQIKTLQKTNHS